MIEQMLIVAGGILLAGLVPVVLVCILGVIWMCICSVYEFFRNA
jgi:hypothetical protein